MRRQTDRYAINLPAEVFVEGHRHQVELHDLSRSGMFLRLPTPLRVGTRLHVAIAPEGPRRVTTAIVTHALGEIDAHALGRSPGVGIAFREPLEATDHLFAITVDRLVRQWRARAAPAAVVLRGSLAAIGLPALLTLLEHERKTGRIELVADHTGWIDLVEGRIVGASSSVHAGDLRSTILSLLDWTHGTFALSATAGASYDESERVLPITYLLLEHARLTDEARAALS